MLILLLELTLIALLCGGCYYLGKLDGRKDALKLVDDTFKKYNESKE